MKTESNIYTSSTFQAFCSIEKGDFKEKIRFCHRHMKEINNLPLEEYVKLLDSYGEALFETGRYLKHIEVADELVELSMEHNIVYLGEKDLYFDTLFQKAASCFNLHKTEEAIYILEQLQGMQPDNESARLFLINCYVRQGASRLSNLRKWSVVAILASAGIIAVELILIRPLVPSLTDIVEAGRNVLFLGGAVTLVTGEVWVRFRAVMKMMRKSR